MSDYSDLILSKSPVLYWRLDETSGTNINDHSASGLDGTVNGTVTLGEPSLLTGDAADKSARFANSTGWISVVHDATHLDLTDGRPITIEQWYNVTAAEHSGSSQRYLSTKGGTTTTNHQGWTLYDNGQATDIDLTFGYRKASGVNQSLTHNGLAFGLHHVVGVIDPGNADILLYVDGVEVASNLSVASPTPVTETGAVTLGNDANGGSHARGWLDEFAIYRTRLDAASIAENYDVGLGNFSSAASGNPIRMII